MSARVLSRTDGKAIPGKVSAAWQGTALPDGETFRNSRPHPFVHDFGRTQ
jgi:hypothetical protein